MREDGVDLELLGELWTLRPVVVSDGRVHRKELDVPDGAESVTLHRAVDDLGNGKYRIRTDVSWDFGERNNE